MANGSILCGGVGSGKSRTSIGYFFSRFGGKKKPDLFIITTARKRDTGEWEDELRIFGLSADDKQNVFHNKVRIDSWNNIKKYTDEVGAFFIFDEQRVVGHGEWVKSFLEITSKNGWILLSATPGDTWSDYIPVFIANGFYKNRAEFVREHVIFCRFAKYPKVDRYVNEGRLIKYRNQILVDMDFERPTHSNYIYTNCSWDVIAYKKLIKTRWNPYEDEPVRTPAQLAYLFRRIVNSDPDRVAKAIDILRDKKRAIVFYNFNYELESLREALQKAHIDFGEWNGSKHEDIPKSDSWAYLVQYTAGCEGWNCITTDTTIFFSQNYSYRVMEQASGRINRMNTPYKELYYYVLTSSSPIDIAIKQAVSKKKQFNETKYAERYFVKFSAYDQGGTNG